MALIHPVHTLLVPFLLVVTIPLAVFAGITTTIAFSILTLRVIVVYLDIVLSLVPQCFGVRLYERRRPLSPTAGGSARDSGSSASTSDANNSNTPTPLPCHHQRLHRHPQQLQNQSQFRHHKLFSSSLLFSAAAVAATSTSTSSFPPRRHHRRPSSSATSIVSTTGSVTPGGGGGSNMSIGLMPSIGPDRDFEGIGGWRDGGNDDENTWITINSRFTLPDRSTYALTHTRNHHRSPSAGGLVTSGDSGLLMMKAYRARSPNPAEADLRGVSSAFSQNSSRVRTPSISRMNTATLVFNPDGYFPLALLPTAIKKYVAHATTN